MSVQPVAIQTTFKDLYVFDKRKNDAARYRKEYKCIPVVIERNSKEKIVAISKHLFLLQDTVTVARLIRSIHEHQKEPFDCDISLFVGEEVLSESLVISKIYQSKKDSDGFLYMTYSRRVNY